MDQSMDTMAEKGRGTDDVMGHLTTGEIVVPLPIAQNQQALAMLTMMFELAGADIEEFTVGNAKNKINPETGHPEFLGGFFGNIIKGAGNALNSTWNTARAVGTDILKLDPGKALQDLGQGAKSIVGDVAKTAMTAATDLGLAPKPNQPSTQATSAESTLTQNQESKNTSLTDPAATGGGGVSSTSSRTVAGPDNEYKLNKNTMIGV